MNELLAALRIGSFEQVLTAYSKAGIDLGDTIDGGVGYGGVTKWLLKVMKPDAVCYAFEPFPGNQRFLNELGPQVRVLEKAMADENRMASFNVSHVVQEDSAWGKQGLTGYCSVGYLLEGRPAAGDVINVECVRAEAEVDAGAHVGAPS